MEFNILLVDDHKMITDFYNMALDQLEIKTKITTTNSLEAAYNLIFNQNEINTFDIIILDFSMPPYIIKKINNGEDFAKQIRFKFPLVKIVFISGILNFLQLKNILKNISPEGIIEKTDISNTKYFTNAIQQILNGSNYKSETVTKSINDNLKIFQKLDDLNRKIIILISKGIKTKNIPNYLHITLSAVNKRKLKIKQILEIENGTDEDILNECKKRGVI